MNNINSFFRVCLFNAVIVLLVRCTTTVAEQQTLIARESYSCTPCGQSCDKDVHTAPGTCSHCQMPLIKTSTVSFKTIQPSELCDYISKNPQVVLLDVRTRAEFEGKSNPNFGAIQNAINLPIQELEAKLDLLSAYKDKQIIVYCSHSRRSPRASYILSQNGFKNVMNMAGGMSVMKDSACKVSTE